MSEAGKLYDKNSSNWVRREPSSLSDFTARPIVFERVTENISNSTILDLGCGEGYCAREFSRLGAGRIDGIDISPEMILRAQEAEVEDGLGNVFYEVGDAGSLPYESDSFDSVVGVFVYNYLKVDEMRASMTEVSRVLRPGGEFIFTVPHPALPFLKDNTPPFYFDTEGESYFSGQNHSFSGKIWTTNGIALPVIATHKLMADYFSCLRDSGFESMPDVLELGVTEEHLGENPEFFGPLKGLPLHMMIDVVS